MEEENKDETIVTKTVAVAKSKLGENSTIWGLLLLVLALIQNPDVFSSLTSLIHTIRTGDNLSAVTTAFAALLLIILKERNRLNHR